MSYKLSISSLLTLMLTSTSALALTCANDYGGNAGCASNTTAAGDCRTLGYSTEDVTRCNHYLYCPFDPKYKKCVVPALNCSGYNLASCPADGICVSCKSGNTTKYALASCKTGYAKILDTCQKVYESCEAGGYVPDNINRVCSTSDSIYLTNGQSTTCYSSCNCAPGYALEDPNDRFSKCVKTYESCDEIGYRDYDANAECSVTKEIYLGSGNKRTCYSGCKCKKGYIENEYASVCEPFLYSCITHGYWNENAETADGATCKEKRYYNYNGEIGYCLTNCTCKQNGYAVFDGLSETRECVRVYYSCADAGLRDSTCIGCYSKSIYILGSNGKAAKKTCYYAK